MASEHTRNTCLTEGDLRRVYDRHIPLREDSLWLVNDMVVTESQVSATLQHIFNAIDISAVDFRVSGMSDKIAGVVSDAFRLSFPGELSRAIRQLFMYGYATFAEYPRDASTTLDGGGERIRGTVDMPVVQDPSMFTPYVCVHRSGAVTVVCLPKKMGYGPGSDLITVGAFGRGTSGVAPPRTPLQTYVWCMPDASSGEIMSPLASLLKDWIENFQTSSCRLRAMIARANPPTVTEFKDLKGTLDGVVAGFAETFLAEKNVNPDEPNQRRRDYAYAQQMLDDQQDAVANAIVAGNDEWWAHFLNPRRMRGYGGHVPPSIMPTRDRRVDLPPHMGLSTGMPMPEEPHETLAQRQAFGVAVAHRLGIPLGIIGAGSSARTRVEGTEQQNHFSLVIVSYAEVLERCAEAMFRHCLSDHFDDVRVNIPTRVVQDKDMLCLLYEAGIISRRRLCLEFERVTGIPTMDEEHLEWDGRQENGPVVFRSMFGDGSRLQDTDGPITYTKRERQDAPQEEDEDGRLIKRPGEKPTPPPRGVRGELGKRGYDRERKRATKWRSSGT